MKLIQTLSNQQLIDLAMQGLGDVERVYELCLLNDLSLTDDTAGLVLLLPEYELDKRRVINLFANASLAPASEDDAEDDELLADPVNANILPPLINKGKVTVLNNQELIDLAMQELGDVERVYDLCLLNDLSLTDLLTPGVQMLIPVFAAGKRSIVSMFSNSSLKPASNDDDNEYSWLPPGGIGYMQIENTFITS